jgi:hypothetical protein
MASLSAVQQCSPAAVVYHQQAEEGALQDAQVFQMRSQASN